MIRDLGEGDWHLEEGECPVCGFMWCAISRSGTIVAHKRRDRQPRIVDVLRMIQSAEDILTEARKSMEKMQGTYLCSQDVGCPNAEIEGRL